MFLGLTFTRHLTVPNFESTFQNSVQSFKIFQALSVVQSTSTLSLFKVQEETLTLNLRDHFSKNFASLKSKSLAKYWQT